MARIFVLLRQLLIKMITEGKNDYRAHAGKKHPLVISLQSPSYVIKSAFLALFSTLPIILLHEVI